MSENIIEKTLLENIKNLNTIFIFPTQTAADLWADRIITISDVHAVAMNRFVAWDSFKGQSIRSQHQDKTSIPSAMRKIFTNLLISQNAQEPIFKNLIIPQYAKTAAGFENWISSLLPTLATWKRYFEKSGFPADEQDSDLLKLYDLYNEFLLKFNFFDPAWETPPFKADGHHYFIFFPEILSDYFEYETILRASEDITLINFTPENMNSVYQIQKPDVLFFNNSRSEIKNIASFLRKIHENSENSIAWNDIAISVPDIEIYGPYIDRELTLHEIPHVSRNAATLSTTGAGSFFEQVNQCASANYSYESLKTLLLNSELPWKPTAPIKQLLQFGQENHCICSFKYKNEQIDVWEKSFKERPQSELEATFYHSLKIEIKKLSESKTFMEIRDHYFEFREKLFDMSLCSKKSDLILSRCISELSELLDLERDFLSKINKEQVLASPFSFFVSYISKINYLEQTDKLGVQIVPYKLTATAPFACQIIVDASQSSLSVIYKQLNFLRDDKRKQLLKREDPNVTEQFIQLYNMNSYACTAYFTAAEKTFNGYAQTSSYLTEVDLRKNKTEEELFGDNPYNLEKKWFLGESEEFPKKLMENQQKSFKNWLIHQNFDEFDANSKEIFEKISNSENLSISVTQLKSFVKCPRAWLFDKRLNLVEENNIAVLMDQFQMGSLYHKILELYCNNLGKLPLHLEDNKLPDEYQTILQRCITQAIDNWENPYITKQLLETTRTALEKTMFATVEAFSSIFEGCTVENSEGKFQFTPEGKDYSCNGRIDCLLRDPTDGDTILVDFKSSKNSIPKNLFVNETSSEENPETTIIELPDFQMPMYIYLLKNSKNITVDNACFFNIKECKCVPVFGANLQERLHSKKEYPLPIDFEPTIKCLIDNLDLMSQKIHDCDFEISDEKQDYETCRSCAHNSICRKNFNVGKRDV